MTPLNCSGVVTLSKHKLKGQRYVELDLGDATKVKVVDLYFTHFTNRKALYTDIEIEARLIFETFYVMRWWLKPLSSVMPPHKINFKQKHKCIACVDVHLQLMFIGYFAPSMNMLVALT